MADWQWYFLFCSPFICLVSDTIDFSDIHSLHSITIQGEKNTSGFHDCRIRCYTSMGIAWCIALCLAGIGGFRGNYNNVWALLYTVNHSLTRLITFPKNFGLDCAIIILPILTCDVDIAGNSILLRGHGDKKQGREIVFWWLRGFSIFLELSPFMLLTMVCKANTLVLAFCHQFLTVSQPK